MFLPLFLFLLKIKKVTFFHDIHSVRQQARKPQSYTCSKLQPPGLVNDSRGWSVELLGIKNVFQFLLENLRHLVCTMVRIGKVWQHTVANNASVRSLLYWKGDVTSCPAVKELGQMKVKTTKTKFQDIHTSVRFWLILIVNIINVSLQIRWTSVRPAELTLVRAQSLAWHLKARVAWHLRASLVNSKFPPPQNYPRRSGPNCNRILWYSIFRYIKYKYKFNWTFRLITPDSSPSPPPSPLLDPLGFANTSSRWVLWPQIPQNPSQYCAPKIKNPQNPSQNDGPNHGQNHGQKPSQNLSKNYGHLPQHSS